MRPKLCEHELHDACMRSWRMRRNCCAVCGVVINNNNFTLKYLGRQLGPYSASKADQILAFVRSSFERYSEPYVLPMVGW